MRRRPRAFVLHRLSLLQAAIDFALASVAYYLGFKLRFDTDKVPAQYSDLFNHSWYIAGLCVVVSVWVMGGYHRSWRYGDQRDDLRAVQGVVLGLLLLYAVNAVLQLGTTEVGQGIFRRTVTTVLPNGVLGVALIAGVLLLVGVRVAVRAIADGRLLIGRRIRPGAQSTLIVGAGDGGRLVLREMLRNQGLGLHPAGFVDDAAEKQRTKVDGVRVLGRIDELPRIIDDVEPDQIVIAIPSAPGTLRAQVLRAGRSRGVPVRTLPTVFELLQGDGGATGQVVRQVREVGVEDVLGREPVKMELHRVGAYLADRVVLVTGAGGSIGSELCRQIARVGPRRIVLLDHAEDNLFRIERELLDDRQVPEGMVASVIADVKDGERIREVLAAHEPAVVFHAAAYKHVGLMQQNPVEAVHNNAIATRSMTRLCGEAGVERFVQVSTDKAVDPSTVMGASKALAELAVEAAAQRWPGTRYSCVRFGNVLGSSGSVVPIFQRQIRLGGPVTVTDARMTRFFMTIPEAVQLVIQGGSLGRTGEILVLDMGEAVEIMKLAREMIELSGLVPERDIAIEVVGPRPGEKLHEELFNAFETPEATEAERISRARRAAFAPEVVEAMFDEIGYLVLQSDAAGVAAKVAELQGIHAASASGPSAGDDPVAADSPALPVAAPQPSDTGPRAPIRP